MCSRLHYICGAGWHPGVQLLQVIPDFGVITAQELVGSSSHVNIIGLALIVVRNSRKETVG